MANLQQKFAYEAFVAYIAGKTFRALIERDTSTYSPNPDHAFVSDWSSNGGVELTAAGYARANLANAVATKDDANNQVYLSFDTPVNFGNTVTAGQTAKAMILYIQTGGNDSTPADDPFVAYLDGKTPVFLGAPASSGATTLYCEKLLQALANGTALDFGGGATCTLTAAASAGARQLSVTALGASAAAGAKAQALIAGGLPIATANGKLEITIPAGGLLLFPTVF